MQQALNRNAFQSRPGWRGTAFAKARAQTSVRLSIHHVDDLPGYDALRFAPPRSPDYQEAVAAREESIREAMVYDFGRDDVFSPDQISDLARQKRACARTDALLNDVSRHPLETRIVEQGARYGFILLERRQLTPQEDVAETIGLDPRQCKNEWGINIKRQTLDHELGHVILVERPQHRFLQKHNELHSDQRMTTEAYRRHDAPTARYGLDWRLLHNMCSPISYQAAGYFNSLSLLEGAPIDPVRELAATFELKEAVFRAHKWGEHIPPRTDDLMAYVNDCLTSPYGEEMRVFYNNRSPATTLNLLVATQHLQSARFALPETAALMAHTARAARQRVYLPRSI